MNVLVVCARGLHLGFLGAYGNDWIDTPALDRIAAEGVVFDQHFADCPSPSGARRAWRRGRYQFPSSIDVGVEPDLLDLLHAAGVPTALLLDASRPAPEAFTAGWGQVERITTGEATPLELLLDATLAHVERHREQGRALIWADFGTLLPPWDVPADYLDRYCQPEPIDEEDADAEGDDVPDEPPIEPLLDPVAGPLDANDDITFVRLQRTYAATVALLDDGIDLLMEALRERGWLDELLLIVTTDDGPALGEHGFVGPCRAWLNEERVHLPLVLRLPGAAEAGRRVAALTQSIDLLPTLLEALGVAIPPDLHGHSVLPLARGERVAVREYACAGLTCAGEVEWYLRTPDWTFVLPQPEGAGRPPQLYRKPEDRWEVNSVIQHHPELAEHFEKVLREFVERSRNPGSFVPPPLVPPEPTSAPPGA